MSLPDWQQRAERKRAQRDALLPKAWLIDPIPDSRVNVVSLPSECGLLTTRELEITEMDVKPLLSCIAERKYTAVEVATAFCKRAAIAQQAVNCLTEIMFDSAIEQAKELDAHLEKTGKVVGTLHGLPISLKDQCQIQGMECSMCFVGWIGHVSQEDAVIVKILRDAGAVFHCRTNLGQGLTRGETDNFVFGRTLNPFNRSLSASGSSGGEAALQAMRGSLVGVGTDLGCSIRSPAAVHGLYGLRPTNGRLPYRGLRNVGDGNESFTSVVGPLSTSLEGVVTFVKAIVNAQPAKSDPAVVPISWRQDDYELRYLDDSKLCFGVLRNDGLATPLPPVQRALESTIAAIRRAGHSVIEFDEIVPTIQAIRGLWNKLLFADGEQEIDAILQLSGEPRDPLGEFASPDDALSAYDFILGVKQRTELRATFLKQWQATAERTKTGRPIDALLSPVRPTPSRPYEQEHHGLYTSAMNAFDLPSIAFPVTQVDPALDAHVTPPFTFNDVEDEQNYRSYDPSQSQNAQIGLMLVGQRFEEETLLGITRLVTALL